MRTSVALGGVSGAVTVGVGRPVPVGGQLFASGFFLFLAAVEVLALPAELIEEARFFFFGFFWSSLPAACGAWFGPSSAKSVGWLGSAGPADVC